MVSPKVKRDDTGNTAIQVVFAAWRGWSRIPSTGEGTEEHGATENLKL